MTKNQQHILIAGNDDYLVQSRASVLLKELAPEDPLNVEIIQGHADHVESVLKQIAGVIEAVQTLPFFGGRKLIHFKDVNFMGDTVLGRSEAVLEQLTTLAELLEHTPPESAQVLISAGIVDKRRAFFKKFSAFGRVEFFDKLDINKTRDYETWLGEVEQRLRSNGLEPDTFVVERLVEAAGNDSRALEQEIEKLRLYAGEGKVSEADVRAICSGNREMLVWDWCDAVTQGQTKEAVAFLEKLLNQGESEFSLLILLSQHLRLAALGCHLLETRRLSLQTRGHFISANVTPEGETLLPKNKKGDKPNLFRLSKAVHQARQKKSPHWFGALEILHRTHHRLMTGGIDRRQVLKDAMLEICLLG